MNELNLVEVMNNEVVTTSRQVADVFEKRHKNVLEAIENKMNSAENSAQYKKMFILDKYKDKSGKLNKQYIMNRDGFTFIAFGFTGAKADSFKLKYIQAFNEMEKKLKEQRDLSTPSYLIENRAERARAWAEEEEERIRLAKENQKQSKYIEENAERTNLGKAIEHSETDILVRQLSKILKGNGIDIGEKRLFKYLRNNGYLIAKKGRDYNSPTQKSMDLGLFKVKETTFERNNQVFTKSTTLVTPKGQLYFAKKFLMERDENE